MREPLVSSTSNQWRRRYSSPRSRVLVFQVEQIVMTSYRVQRQVNERGTPGSPRLIAAASKVPAMGSIDSLMNSGAVITHVLEQRARLDHRKFAEDPRAAEAAGVVA